MPNQAHVYTKFKYTWQCGMHEWWHGKTNGSQPLETNYKPFNWANNNCYTELAERWKGQDE